MEKIENVSNFLRKMENTEIVEINKEKIKIKIIKGSNKIVSIPLFLSEDLSYIVAAIICDGHLKTDKYRVYFENVNKEVIIKMIEKTQRVFDTTINYKIKIDKRGGRKPSYVIRLNSKPVVMFLSEVFNIPRGKKSHIVIVPEIIKKSNKNIKNAFLEGVFDTDGGKRGRGLGLSCASITFRNDLIELLSDLDIIVHKDEWLNKKYNKTYYGFYFKPTGKELFLKDRFL